MFIGATCERIFKLEARPRGASEWETFNMTTIIDRNNDRRTGCIFDLREDP